jgi:hypothetical protein
MFDEIEGFQERNRGIWSSPSEEMTRVETEQESGRDQVDLAPFHSRSHYVTHL